MLSGSYAIQSAAARISLAVQILDVETGRIIGGEVAELPYTGDIKSILSAPTTTTANVSQPPGETDPVDVQPSVSTGPIVVKLVSIDKVRDGSQIQLVLSVRNLLKNTLEMALIPDDLPVLLDNTGATWLLKSQSGINIDRPNGQIHVWTSFAPGSEAILSFVFSSKASAGTSFTFTGGMISRIDGVPYDSYNPPRIPVGLAGMRPR